MKYCVTSVSIPTLAAALVLLTCRACVAKFGLTVDVGSGVNALSTSGSSC